MGPHPAVAEVRAGVRRCLADLAADPPVPPQHAAGDSGPGTRTGGPARLPFRNPLVLVACSGGPDSLALAAAVAHEAPRGGLRAGGVTVDHGLQQGSDTRAREIAGTLASLGLDPVHSVPVSVTGPGGPEAAARVARYAALDEVARRTGAAAILLGHTLDDQAETVLLGLARGSGSRSLAGMPGRRGWYRRPLLGVSRATVRAACAAQGLTPWEDPQNADPAFARARVRHQALPALESALGPGVAAALARTAGQLRDDSEVLDGLARAEAERLRPSQAGLGWDASSLAALPRAIRTRVLRDAAIQAGCPPGALTWRHVEAMEALVTGWRGQRWADLPGAVRASRRYGKLLLTVGAEREDEPSDCDDAEAVGGRE